VETASHSASDGAARVLGDLLYGNPAKTPISEREWVGLVQATAAGDQRALHRLYERTHRMVFTLSMRLTNDRHAA
jgi:hypothetical protein